MKKQPVYIRKAIEEQLNYLESYSEKTIRNYKNHLKQFLIWHGKKPTRSESMLNTLKAYRKHLLTLKYKPATINLNLTTVKKYYNNVLNLYDEINRLKVKVNHRVKPKDIYTPDEITKLLNSTHNIKHLAFFRLGFGNGCRLNEILAIKKRDININNHEIYLEKRMIIADTETMKLLMTLTQYKTQDDYVFSNSKGHQLTERSLQHAFYKACKKIGLKNKGGFSTLKKSHIINQLNAGSNLEHIKDTLGYTSLKTVQVLYGQNAHDNRNIGKSILNDNIGIIKQYIISVYGNGKITMQELKE